ncbi:hypothetical protein AVEN_188424-1 [Araneus ventricosus]|uniref:Uncharacterized protein n=1 Tax=Araneus ventricosus TaxID=182803 RepID=A0A4Y2SLF9_ARAVE|nr:hypothetical protein AVEN_188424-1 [Araneus ventricosus]
MLNFNLQCTASPKIPPTLLLRYIDWGRSCCLVFAQIALNHDACSILNRICPSTICPHSTKRSTDIVYDLLSSDEALEYRYAVSVINTIYVNF